MSDNKLNCDLCSTSSDGSLDHAAQSLQSAQTKLVKSGDCSTDQLCRSPQASRPHITSCRNGTTNAVTSVHICRLQSATPTAVASTRKFSVSKTGINKLSIRNLQSEIETIAVPVVQRIERKFLKPKTAFCRNGLLSSSLRKSLYPNVFNNSYGHHD